ncbi:hypothetical protein [Streptomyces longwoodensis]|uniref:hypothetical protein n=1 Tax=Streptomyces longwoodensis TaxID=68231 RepID=UPI0034026AD3
MRSIFLTKSLLAATLGCAALTACGTLAPSAGTGVGRASAAPAAAHAPATELRTSPAPDDSQAHFLALLGDTARKCASHGASDKGDTDTPEVLPDSDGGKETPRPEDLPGGEGPQTPRYGPGQTPPGNPDAHGDIAVALPAGAPRPPAPAAAPHPGAPREVELTEAEACEGTAHADRVTGALQGTAPTGYPALLEKLTGLAYPAERIHRMPQRPGEPRARIDLRLMGGHLVLEVTSTRDGVVVEPFGAPETEDVQVTDVQRTP